MTTYVGSCHCGRTRFEVDAQIDHVRVCDCSICRRRGALNFRVAKGSLRLLTPWEDLVCYQWGSRTALDYFCPTCGILPFRRPSDPNPEELRNGIEPFDGWAINVRCLDAIDLEQLPRVNVHGSRINLSAGSDATIPAVTDLLPVSNGGITLRLLHESDLSVFHAYRSDPELARYQSWLPMSRTSALEFLQSMTHISSLQPGQWIQLGIAAAGSGKLLGDMGVFLAADLTFAEIGFTLAAEYHGHGYASQAVSALLPLIRSCVAVKHIRAVTDARNQSSIRLLQSQGFNKSEEYATVFKGQPCTEQVYLLAIGELTAGETAT